MREYLLIVCAGDKSLHHHWVVSPRQYDIMIIYFGNDDETMVRYQGQCDYFYKEKGLKLELARKVLLHQLHFSQIIKFDLYKYIWFADDDLKFDNDHDVDELFGAAAQLGADLFQPAIQNNNVNPAWEPTQMLAGAFAHRTNIVEFMMPGFSGEIFTTCFFPALHALDFSKAGWGIEVILMRIGEAALNRPLRTFVIDSVPINHTRFRAEGGGQSDRLGYYEASYLPQIYTNRIQTLAIYGSLQEALEDRSIRIERNEVLIENFHAKAYERVYR